MATSTALCSSMLHNVHCGVQSSPRQCLAFRTVLTHQKWSARRQPVAGRHRRRLRVAAEDSSGQSQRTDTQTAPAGSERPGDKVEVPDELKSEADRKAEEIERLRAAEKFMTKGTGEGECQGCGYNYSPREGDDEYPVPKGTTFENLPEDWQCPVCGASKKTFKSKAITVAGFAENQKYGFGTNTMTEGQKSLLIFGSLGFFFVLFLLGYLL